jgi:hypothetical protein
MAKAIFKATLIALLVILKAILSYFSSKPINYKQFRFHNTFYLPVKEIIESKSCALFILKKN